METKPPAVIYLYTTSACHLCESPEQKLASVQTQLVINKIEIAEDDDLIMKYGEKIPVLQRSDNHLELHWPFSVSDIELFLCD